MSLDRQYGFWGSLSPLGGLSGAALLVMASGRLSWAVTIAGNLFWVYGLTALTFSLLSNLIGNKFFPESGNVSGNKIVYACIASFWGSIYIFLFWLMCPFAAIEVFMLLILVPLFCAESGVTEHKSDDIQENVSGALSQAAILTCLLILFSIIREPLAYCMLSFPGTYQGMITIMYYNENSFFPIEVFSSSAGALLVLGYFTCLYQYTKSFIMPGSR